MLCNVPFCSWHVGYYCIQPSLTQDKSRHIWSSVLMCKQPTDSLSVAASEVLIYHVMCVHLSGITEFINVTSVFRLFPQQILASFHSK